MSDDKQLVFGPPGFDKIALIGSAPSSVHLAPYKDMSWAVWAVSPACYPVVPRSEVWFETHRFAPAPPGPDRNAPGTKPWFSPEFTAFLAAHPLVFMNEKHPSIPNSERLIFEELVAKYGPYHFTSTVAWMLAMAIELKPKTIGLWGIDMSAHEEHAYQRPGCQHFLGLAMQLGINVVLPPESDLMQPGPSYGLCELSPLHIKLTARIAEFETRLTAATNTQAQAAGEMMFLRGAIDDAKYMLATWAGDVQYNPMHAASMAVGFIKPRVSIVRQETPPVTPPMNWDEKSGTWVGATAHKGNGSEKLMDDAHPT